eukprot:944183-Alexandrium_andersonii.AAC.1
MKGGQRELYRVLKALKPFRAPVVSPLYDSSGKLADSPASVARVWAEHLASRHSAQPSTFEQ